MMQPAQGEPTPRVPLAIAVRRDDGAGGEWRSVNVSEGGCFLAGGGLLHPGEQVLIGLRFAADATIVTRARVVWLNSGARRLSTQLPVGMGLQFLDLCDALRALLRSRLEAATAHAPAGDHDAPLPNGAQLGWYRILAALGTSRIGHVYLAEHQLLGRRVVVKTLHPVHTRDALACRRFFDEARAINRVDHPHIIEIVDFVTQGELSYFVLEPLVGRSLRRAQVAGMSLMRRVRVMRQLASALAAAHGAGITHGGLRPDNVLLVARDGNPDFVKLIDFGVAMLAAQCSAAADNLAADAGALDYRAPEQRRGRLVDYRADIYAFGVMLQRLAAGGGVPEALTRLTARCLESTPERRPESMHEVVDLLDQVADALAVAPSRVLEMAPAARSTLALSGLVAVIVLLLSILAMAMNS